LSVFFATAAELEAAGNAVNPRCGFTGVNKTVNGSVENVGIDEMAQITLGDSSATVLGLLGVKTFQLKDVPMRTLDLIATRSTRSGSTLLVNKLIVRRDQNPADGSTLPVLDFLSSEAFAPATANVTISGLGTDETFLVAGLITANGTSAFVSNGSASTATTQFYSGVPDSKLIPGDLHQLFVSAAPVGSSDSSREAEVFFHSVADRSVTLGAPLSAPTITTTGTTPYLQLRAQLPTQSDYDRFGQISYSQGSGGASRRVSVAMTKGYAGSAGYDLLIPDLSAAAGWNNAWGLQPAVSTQWNAEEFGGTLLFGFQAPSEGASVVAASLRGSISSP
jgi:hypothetical protein